MQNSGLFITLYDFGTLSLYLSRGIYGFLMNPEPRVVSPRSRHYHALADYACSREGSHVFFFLRRKIVYGGHVTGTKQVGSFSLNGPYSPMGAKAGSKIYWDESQRTCYEATATPGIFKVPIGNEKSEKCQPYLIQFKDPKSLKGRTIASDDLYFELGSYPYPLPSNAIQDMSFCTLTPGEVDILLRLLQDSPDNMFEETSENIQLTDSPLMFRPDYGLHSPSEAASEAELEASVLANPALLPQELRPGDSALCRQIPISPFKPSQMDRADICYYSRDPIRNGTIPNKVIELKNDRAGKQDVLQVVRYLKWFQKVIPSECHEVSFSVAAPSFSRGLWSYVPPEFRDQLEFVPLSAQRLLI